jgi:hypothetical protein
MAYLRLLTGNQSVAQMQPVTLADDVENKQILLQLAAGNKVSMHKALAPLGIDPDEDIKTIFEENAQFQEYRMLISRRCRIVSR